MKKSGLLLSFAAITLFYQNCSQPFEVSSSVRDSASSLGAGCYLNDGTLLQEGQSYYGYALDSVTSPVTCGARLQARCENGLLVPDSGQSALPQYSACTQYCLHPDSNAPVSSVGSVSTISIPTYFRVSSAATQTACDAARVPASTSTCQASSGQFSPAVVPQAQRFSNCTVTGGPVMCAYPAGSQYVQPSDRNVGARVSGLSVTSALYPQLCSQASVERTCLSSGQWNGPVPVYQPGSCTQQCVNPRTQMAMAAFTGNRNDIANLPVTTPGLYFYYSRQMGSQDECAAARVIGYCDQSSGRVLSSASNMPITVPVTQQYTSCAVIAPTPSPTPAPTPVPTATPAPTATPVPPTGTLTSARVFFSGHSLVDFLPRYMPAIATSLGDEIQYNHQFIGGSLIWARTRGDRNVTTWPGYSRGDNRTGSGMNVINEFLRPQTITGGAYDTLVIAERHDVVNPIQWEDTVRYLRHYHDRFIAGNSRGVTYFYEAWWDINKSNPANWVNYERAASTAWQCVATRINESLARENRSDRIRSIPAGAAFAQLVNRATTGTVTGLTGSNSVETLNRLFTDNVHPTALASYYMSLVTYSFIYKKSPANAAVPNGISAATATELKRIAWDFTQSYLATNAPLTLAQCRDYYRNSFCSTFGNFGNDTRNVLSCQNFFGVQSNANPFYYNPATDSSYWF